MKEVSIAALYSSPIRRAVETASCVGKAIGLDVCVNDDLREVALRPDPQFLRCLGSGERTAAVCTCLHDDEIAALQTGIWSQVPGYESSETCVYVSH
jgi:hypothetical protein